MPVALWPRLYRTVTVRDCQVGPVKDPVLTITLDNGKEISGHREVDAALAADMYFTRPYHSWEHGLNEYANGLVRQYFRKGMSLLGIAPGQVREVADRLNSRSR